MRWNSMKAPSWNHFRDWQFIVLHTKEEKEIETKSVLTKSNLPVSDIDRVKDMCNLVWLENLNLRGSYKADILGYINEKHSELMPLYQEIYNQGSRLY